MDQGGTPVILTGVNNVDGRRKRSIKYTDDLTDEDFELFKLHAGSKRSNRHKRASPPKAKFSKENATQYCTKGFPIQKLENSAQTWGLIYKSWWTLAR